MIVGGDAGVGGGLCVFDNACIPHMSYSEFLDWGKYHIVYLIHFSHAVGGDIAVGDAVLTCFGVEESKELIDYCFVALNILRCFLLFILILIILLRFRVQKY